MMTRPLAVILASAAVMSSGLVQADSPRDERTIAFPSQVAAREFQLAWVGVDGVTEQATLSEHSAIARFPRGSGCLAGVSDEEFFLSYLGGGDDGESAVDMTPATLHGALIQGFVTDDEGIPLRAEVAVADAEMLFKGWEEPEVEVCRKALEALGVLRTSTSQNGEFSLGPIMQGPLELSAFSEGHSSETVRLLIPEEYIGRIYEVSGISLQPVAKLIARLDSSEMDRRGPIQVILDRHDPLEFEVNKQWIPTREGRLGEDEPLEFIDLRPGNYRMRIADDEISYKLDVELVPGISEVTVFPRPVFIEGRVLDGNIGVEDAEVALLDYGTQTSAVTDSEGRYALTVWHLADFGVFVKHPDGPSIADHLDLQDAEFGSTVERDFIFSTAMLEGTVVSKKDGSPIPAAKVSLRIELEDEERGVVRGATTDDDGQFSFDRIEEDPTSAVLVTRKDGFVPKTTEPVLAAGETTTVWIELEEGQEVNGVVRGPAGETVAGARVVCSFQTPTGRPLQSATTDAEGRFELSAAPGSVVFASARGYGLGWAVASDADTIITLAALHGGARVRLVFSGGHAIVGARVTATDDSGTAIPHHALSTSLLLNGLPTASGEDGIISLPVLPAGGYRIGLLDHSGTIGGGRIMVPIDVIQDVVAD